MQKIGDGDEILAKLNKDISKEGHQFANLEDLIPHEIKSLVCKPHKKHLKRDDQNKMVGYTQNTYKFTIMTTLNQNRDLLSSDRVKEVVNVASYTMALKTCSFA